MLGAFLALMSAATFAANNAVTRRGVITGSALQALSISVPIGVPMFLLGAIVTGGYVAYASFSGLTYFYLAMAGVLHFAWGRYCNYRAVKAIGSNLAGPLQESSVLIALFFAVVLLGEQLTPLKIVGILFVLLGPLVAVELGRKKAPKKEGSAKPAFTPLYAEGYLFAGLSALGYGTSPIFIRAAIENAGPGASLAGGVISYLAASVIVAIAVVATGSTRSVLSMDRTNAKWFSIAGVLVGISQMLRYMALAIAPVTVVAPIQRLSLIFRLLFGWILNREHEIFSSRLIFGTVISLFGAVLLALSTEGLADLQFAPDWLKTMATWKWP